MNFDVCNSLEDFILQVKQGKRFRVEDCDYDFYSIPVDDNLKIIYRTDDSSLLEMYSAFVGLLDCASDKLMLDLHEFNSSMTSILLSRDECSFDVDEMQQKLKDSRFDNVTLTEIIFEEVRELLYRYISDYICQDIDDKDLFVKDLSLNYRDRYTDIQKLAMGINNFSYIDHPRFSFIENICNEDRLLEYTVGFLNGGLEYLHNLVFDNIGEFRIPEAVYNSQKYYLNTVNRYRNIKGNVDEFIKDEIKRAIGDKKSVYINGIQFKDFSCNKDDVFEFGRLPIKYSDIQTIKYAKKEIFNRAEAVKRLGSAEYQAGINTLIEFVRHDFEKYNRREVISEVKWSAGDLVYMKDGHFGIVMGENKIYLDSNKTITIDINQKFCDSPISVLVEASDLNQELSEIRNQIVTRYNCKVQQSLINKHKKTDRDSERER